MNDPYRDRTRVEAARVGVAAARETLAAWDGEAKVYRCGGCDFTSPTLLGLENHRTREQVC